MIVARLVDLSAITENTSCRVMSVIDVAPVIDTHCASFGSLRIALPEQEAETSRTGTS